MDKGACAPFGAWALKLQAAVFDNTAFFDRLQDLGGPLAQLAEQHTFNVRVDGSIPSRLTISFCRGLRRMNPHFAIGPDAADAMRMARRRPFTLTQNLLE